MFNKNVDTSINFSLHEILNVLRLNNALKNLRWGQPMIKICVYLFSALFLLSQAFTLNTYSIDKKDISNSINLSTVKIPFILNEGQYENGVKFYANTFHGGVLVTNQNEIVYSINKNESETFVFKEYFLNANDTKIKGENRAITKANYFNGNIKSQWKTNVPSFEKVNLGEVFDGIEVKLKNIGNNVEKYFYVKSGGDPNNIKMKISGVKKIQVNKSGELELLTDHGKVKLSKPIAFQINENEKKYVDVKYTVNDNKYGFEVAKYDKTKELVIDPILAATFYGGNGNDDQLIAGDLMLFDSSGNIIIAGITKSTDLPGIDPGSLDSVPNNSFIAKFTPDLNSLLEVTYFGGSGDFDNVRSMVMDDMGNIFIVGFTDSDDFPNISATSADDIIEVSPTVREGFVIKFNNSLDSILGSTYIGGSSSDFAEGIDIDNMNNVVVAGTTLSTDFPEIMMGTSADDTVSNFEGFVVKFDSNLENILASTYLGGSDNEEKLFGVQIDSSGNVFVAGVTSSNDFPGVGATSVDKVYTDDGFSTDEYFIAKLNSDLSSIIISTYLGGTDGNNGPLNPSLQLFSTSLYFAGRADSTDFPGIGPDSADNLKGGTFEGVISKLDLGLSTVKSTFVGGNGYDEIRGFTLDGLGNIYVVGLTGSDVFPGVSIDSCDNTIVQLEGFVSKIDDSLSTLFASTYLGGSSGNSGGEFAKSVLVNSMGNVVVYGSTRSSDFPGIGAGSYDQLHEGNETYLVILDPDLVFDLDEDGVPDSEDLCVDSDLSLTVIIDGCDSGIDNFLNEDGCTISDLIDEIANSASNHGQFVSGVSHLLNDLKKSGLINGREKGVIQSCAASADIP